MKKLALKKKLTNNDYQLSNEASADASDTHPPLFCRHTWTKSVPFCVSFLFFFFNKFFYETIVLNQTFIF